MSTQPKPVFKQRHVLEKEHQAALAEIAKLKSGGSTRQASAELDRLKAENASLRAKIATGKPAVLTAAAWIAANAGPTMNRDEFHKLTHPQRNEFIRSGGKLI